MGVPFSDTQYGGAAMPLTLPEPYIRLTGAASLSLLVMKKSDSGMPAGAFFSLGNAFLPEEGLSAVFVLYIYPGIKTFGSLSPLISLIWITPEKSAAEAFVIRTFTFVQKEPFPFSALSAAGKISNLSPVAFA
jgi:hypothetical protein